MVKVLLVAALCTVAFADTITYNYTGNSYTVCNGTTSINGTCPAVLVQPQMECGRAPFVSVARASAGRWAA
jgi:hypothetical protein